MRKWIFGLLFIGLASLTFAQDRPKEDVRTVELEGVILTSPNYAYLAEVQDVASSEIVQKLERKVATFDIKESPMYNKIDKAYEVFFSNSKGKIVATYDENGKILSAFEKFGDVVVPDPIRNTVVQAYPDWKMNSNKYLVTYYHDKGAKKVYHFQLEKNNKKKNLKMTWEGLPL
ncbi:MAG: hypothetical protein HKP60_10655 [Eudoraea sp.]|nr:hypothetical protein [Eudoraea sp.]NNJ41318.1 hypothetical protein [Eudoraea sp.]